ncbi:MAG TPA: FAD-dependent oxidoreductase [Pirellulaceae bacterium]|nr:FAD-dependent oxidoreductase [Pirellulaceae bacterium]
MTHNWLSVSFVCLILVATSHWCDEGHAASEAGATVLVEAESFEQLGGWVVDQQVMDQMGSPYLLAHGLGRRVGNAISTVEFPHRGQFRIWVRTRDWVAPWKVPDTPEAMRAVGAPGKFQVLLNGKAVETTFGTEGAQWHWQDGGTIDVPAKSVILALRDLTGFDGRCDAILFSSNPKFTPPNESDKLRSFRKRFLEFSETPSPGGDYDLVVVGGGMAGCCTTVSAARAGCRVALIQNRPVLGGNNSSEVRVGLSGLIHQKPYAKLGNLVDEIGPVGHWNLWEANRSPDSPRSKRIFEIIKEHPEKKTHNAGPPSNYEDQQKEGVVRAEKNASLFLNMHVNEVEMDSDCITAVIAQNIQTGERVRFTGRVFADCTGDGNLGFLAKADFRQGREGKSETNEALAPDQSDKLVMGTSVQWNSAEEDEPSSFPECPWAVHFDEKTCIDTFKGDWNWETGALRDQVNEFERVRDYALRVTYGNWSTLKNTAKFEKKFARRRLSWVAYIGGKRESRRLLGDVILSQQDIVEQNSFPDACVTTTWTIDLHYPKKPRCACDAFQATAKQLVIKPYPIPFRCLYSRNIDNLMMAGRNISVTHVALGTVRVQRTTGMMGEVLGMAASLCKKHTCLPGGVYTMHLKELQELMEAGVPAHNL